MGISYKSAVQMKAAGVGATTVALWAALAGSVFSRNWAAAATAIGGLIVAYNPSLGEVVDQAMPYMPGWIAAIATFVARFSLPRPTPVVPSPNSVIVVTPPAEEPRVPPSPHA